MATFEAHRHATIQQFPMHPFFQPSQYNPNAELLNSGETTVHPDVPDSSNKAQPSGLDGNFDTSNPKQNNKTQLKEIPLNSEQNTASSSQSAQQTSSLQNTRQAFEPEHIDPNHDRRKRRRVSGDGSDIKSHESQRQVQDVTTVSHDGIESHQAQPLRQMTPEQSEFLSQATVHKSPLTRRTPRPTRTTAHKDAAVQETTVGVAGNAGANSLSALAKDSLKPRMLKLGGNGKLLNSSEKSASSKPSKDKMGKSALNSGKVQLRDGKLARSLKLILRYGKDEASRLRTGQRINEILSITAFHINAGAATESKKSAATHPFFLGKTLPRASSTLSSAAESTKTAQQDSDQEEQSNPKPAKPVPWKDIVFKSAKASFPKDIHAVPAIWPPLELQHIGQDSRPKLTTLTDPGSSAKQKATVIHGEIPDSENVLALFGGALKRQFHMHQYVVAPQRLVLDSNVAISGIDQTMQGSVSSHIVGRMRSHAQICTSAFDRAESSGCLTWSHQYAPGEASEVLQPSCDVLREWLKSLTVHNVKQGIDQGPVRPANKKKGRPRKRPSDLDDFIVNDDEEADSATTKNAILLTGPNGCGKTASVFAVARELGFEVFEIHPGMRRNAKDILDKVGDMAQNHLVQRGDSASRGSSVVPATADTEPLQEVSNEQPSVTNFFGSLKKPAAKVASRSGTPQPKKKEQKQSLILFEEVDILFEEDRGFWAGVQSLIQNSKRPVVLTCNDISKIPHDEIELYATLDYSPPEEDTVIQYLRYMAAAQGHIISTQAIHDLYCSKRLDLRATLAELNFWCQMTVGSPKGGLDWFRTNRSSHPTLESNPENIRTFSKDTYRSGLDLLPESNLGIEDTLRYAQHSLDLEFSDWDFLGSNLEAVCTWEDPVQNAAQYYEILASCHSCMDLLDPDDTPSVISAMLSTLSASLTTMSRDHVTSKYISSLDKDYESNSRFFDCMGPLMDEKPVFPPAQGRLAPSIDCSRSSVATDVAPYVRSILSYERGLEDQREAIFGSQSKKSRNTRAARAAAEGGSIAHTRPEKWFPNLLDHDAVMRTGRGWPRWAHIEEEAHESDQALYQNNMGSGEIEIDTNTVQ